MCLWLNTGEAEEGARHCEYGPADGEALHPGNWGDRTRTICGCEWVETDFLYCVWGDG